MYGSGGGGASRQAREELAESFRHVEHLNMECAECHREVPSDGGAGRMVVPTGIDQGYCSSCHSGAFEWSARLRTTDSLAEYRHSRSAEEMGAAFSTGLTKRWRSGAVDFSHAAHVAGFATGEFAREACVICHSGIVSRMQADIVPERFDAGSCSECHSGMSAGTALLEPAPSLTAGSFLHGKHGALACSDCHAPGAQGASGELSSVVLKDSSGGDVYEGCVACHEQVDQPGHTAPLRVEGHGDLEVQGDCSACHVVGSTEATSNAMFRALRPVAVHGRSALQHFLADFSHSEVEALESNAECSQCHRAAPDGVPVERSLASFAHGDHLDLGEGLDGSTCARCHTAMGASTAEVTRAADLALEHRGLEGEGACAACHQSAYELGAPDATQQAAGVERLVFSHAAHRANGCLDCHSPSGESATGIATNDSARTCTECHSHAAEQLVPGQKGLDLAAVQDCALCHALGVPAHGVALEFQRQKLTTLAGEFVHPELKGAHCADCHRAAPRAALAGPAASAGAGDGPVGVSTASARWPGGFRQEDLQFRGRYRLTTDGKGSPHSDKYRDQRTATEERLGVQSTGEGPSGETYFRSHITHPDPEPGGTRCLPCHWNSVDRPSGVAYTNLYSLVSEAQIRTRFAPGLLDAWIIGLSGVRRTESLFPR